jgi:hypothetical protein
VERLFAERITTGCAGNPLRFCPESPVSAWELSTFLGRAFGTP